jgi:DNA-binding CsgD family transcriptional regulator
MEGIIRQFIGIPSTEILILDSNLNLVYWNPQTSQSYLSTPPDHKSAGVLGKSYPLLPGNIMERCIKIRESLSGNHSGQYTGNRYTTSWTEPGRQVKAEIVVLPFPNSSEKPSSLFHFLITLNYVHHSSLSNHPFESHDRKLTYKETEIAKYICQGLTNKEISQRLFVSLPTVVTHVKHIYQKLGVQRRSQLIHDLLS